VKDLRYGRMSSALEEKIVEDLQQWGQGNRGAELTWEVLVEAYGFSRQTFNQKPSIKAAYTLAKKALAGGLGRSRADSDAQIKMLTDKMALLEERVREHERREGLWRERWQRIAFHIRQAGVQVHQMDRPSGPNPPSERETAKILRPFDKPLPEVE